MPTSYTKKGEDPIARARESGHTFVTVPHIEDRAPALLVQGILKKTLQKQLGGISGNRNPSHSGMLGGNPQVSTSTLSRTQSMEGVAKTIADAVKTKLKDLEVPRYKWIVQAWVGENKDQGVHVGTRTLWNADTDNVFFESLETDYLFATVAVYAVYVA